MPVVTLLDFTPPARVDQTWTTVRILESASSQGPWTLIDTFTLDPVDTNPADPQSRDFTTTNATLPAGWYQVVFVDAAGNEQPVTPVQVIAESPFVPSVDDVARLIPVFTMADGGQLGYFTDDGRTNPSASRVAQLIEDAAQLVFARVGVDLPAGLEALVRPVIEIGAALLVILGAEQVNQDRYDRLKTLYDERLAALVDAVQDADAGGDPGGVDDRGTPLGSFPVVVPLDW